MNFDAKEFRQVLGCFATGVTAITAQRQGNPYGMTVNSFASVSLTPPLVLFCATPGGETYRAILESQHYAVNILAQEQQDIALRFAGMTPIGEENRFDGLDYDPSPQSQSPWLNGCLAWLDCKIVQTIEAGDHVLMLAQVLELRKAAAASPLLFFSGQWPKI